MSDHFDVAIIGAGAMGSAAAYHLAKTGKKTLVVDQFQPPHNLGSSHGQSRIIREAYFESPLYVPLVKQAYSIWHQLEKESGKQLFLKTGGLMLGDKGSKVFTGAKTSALLWNVWYEVIDYKEISKRFPAFKPGENTVALYEKNAGLLFPEECIQTQLKLASNNNTTFRFSEKVIAIKDIGDAVKITTNKETYRAGKVIVSAGAWMNTIFPGLHLPLTVARQPLCWFDFETSNRENFSPQKFPIYIWEKPGGIAFYGFPSIDNKMKIAIHHRGKQVTADTVDRNVYGDEIEELRAIATDHFNARFTYSHSAVCMYTNTPSEDFIIDYHPHHKNIIIASPCSGHGFKFSAAIGKILCEMACEEPLSFDINAFRIAVHRTERTSE